MTATVSLSAAPSVGHKAGQSKTVSLAGHTAATAYSVQITDPDGWTVSYKVTTDGSGAGTVSFVPRMAGTYTVSTYLATPAQVATTTFNSGGYG